MTYKELRRQEAACLSSSSKRLRLYGQAYKTILDLYGKCSKDWLSDEQLISSLAKEYINSQVEESKFVQNDSGYKIRVSAAMQLIVNDFADYETTYGYVKNLKLSYEDLSFSHVRELLSRKYYYKQILPSSLRRAVEQAKSEALHSEC